MSKDQSGRTSDDEDSSRTSESLLSGVVRGDAADVERLHKEYTPRMYSWCRRKGLSHEDAQDVTADLMVRLIQGLIGSSFERGRRFRKWLAVVTRNAATDFQRKHGRLLLASGEQLDQLVTEDDIAERVAEDLLLLEAKANVRADAQPRDWEIFVLLTDEGMKSSEVASELDITPPAVYNAKLRIVKALKKEIDRLS